MRLTIIPEDALVILDGLVATLDLSGVSIPDNVHALQWDGEHGFIEYIGAENAIISRLPLWADQCVDICAHIPEPEPTPQDVLVRSERDSLLAATDWTANTDVTMSDEMRAYRQALRDVPSQAGFPNDVTWPTKP